MLRFVPLFVFFHCWNVHYDTLDEYKQVAQTKFYLVAQNAA